jgi:hypothetical protein
LKTFEVITLEGASGIDIQSIVRDIEALNLGYEYGCSDGHISDVIREYFQQHGYFKAEVAKPTCTMSRRDTDQVWIDVRVRVRPG